MSDYETLAKRLQQLEEENQRLKRQVTPTEKPPKPLTTHVSMFKGRPVITFEGPFRPFSFGLKKASAILQKIDDVKFFVQNNINHLNASTDGDGD